jgi:hypothetical protein
MKKIVLCILSVVSGLIFADGDTVAKAEEAEDLSTNNSYIDRAAYIQNPYIGMPSFGGTQSVSESALVNQSAAQKLFTDGTWNVIGEATYVNIQGGNNFAYGGNIFGQTGQIAGFSFGGLFTVMNPFYSTQINPNDINYQAQTTPINRQITPQELFAEYQYSNIVQVDAGYIGINNSPWLTYYQNNVLNLVTYQGATVNIHPLNGWLITALAFNGSQLIGENGFSQQTMYNSTFDFGTQTANIVDHGSPATTALGASYTTSNNKFGFRLWAYQFEDYANMLYADSNLKLEATKDLSFNIALQAAIEGGTPNNALYEHDYSQIQSNMAGLQLSMNYSWFGLQLAYNSIWGPSDAYAGGGLVSPYTYQYATDPLFTTSWMQGMVEKSAGTAYKISTPLTFLDNNLVISPSYAYYNTSDYPISAEYDLTVSYSIPQIKGFTVFAGLGYQSILNPDIDNVYSGQIMFSYLY